MKNDEKRFEKICEKEQEDVDKRSGVVDIATDTGTCEGHNRNNRDTCGSKIAKIRQNNLKILKKNIKYANKTHESGNNKNNAGARKFPRRRGRAHDPGKERKWGEKKRKEKI